MGVCNCSMFCCTSIAIILMGKRELVALLNLSSWCLVMVERLFLAVPWSCLQFVIVVFPDHTHLIFFIVFSRSCVFYCFLLIPYGAMGWSVVCECGIFNGHTNLLSYEMIDKILFPNIISE